MAKSSPLPESRIWNARQIAAFLGHSLPWFYQHRPILEQYGFPKRNSLVDGWDSKAAQCWLDEKSNLMRSIFDSENIQNRMLKAIKNHG